jgi:hypothetical protein
MKLLSNHYGTFMKALIGLGLTLWLLGNAAAQHPEESNSPIRPGANAEVQSKQEARVGASAANPSTEQSPEKFVPKEKISADSAIAFPVDI